MDIEEQQYKRESGHDLSAASSEEPGMREVSEMEADQTDNEASDRREDPKTQTKSSTNVADTRTQQANKRASNPKGAEEREADPRLQLTMQLLRELHAQKQKAAKAQQFERTETEEHQPQIAATEAAADPEAEQKRGTK